MDFDDIMSEVVTMINDNLKLMYLNDNCLIGIKEFIKKDGIDKINHLDYWDLVFCVEEALAELINTEYLYDFREGLE